MLQWWQPRGCPAQVAAEGCAVLHLWQLGVGALHKWQLTAALCCSSGQGLRCAAVVAAVGLRCTGGSCGLRGVAVVAKGCTVLKWWHPWGCTAQVAAEGCTVLHRWQLRGCITL